MAWDQIKVSIDDTEIEAHVSRTSETNQFSIPAVIAMEEGTVFTVGRKKYTAAKVTDVAERGEVLLVETKESKNEKSQKGGTDT